jgi:hypothetical protein
MVMDDQIDMELDSLKALKRGASRLEDCGAMRPKKLAA